MPEYLAPGVYVEEVSLRSKEIEGVSTSTAGFVGATAVGPTEGPRAVTSLTDFERTYGDGCRLSFADVAAPLHNYMWHAARAFFAQGGKRLFVQRVVGERGNRPGAAEYAGAAAATAIGADFEALRLLSPAWRVQGDWPDARTLDVRLRDELIRLSASVPQSGEALSATLFSTAKA